MMLPTLISVSVAPVSYFFWADAVEAEAAMSASASDAAASLPVTADIPISLFSWCVCVPFLVLPVFGDAAAIQYDLPDAFNRKPLRRGCGGCFFSSQAQARARVRVREGASVWVDKSVRREFELRGFSGRARSR